MIKNKPELRKRIVQRKGSVRYRKRHLGEEVRDSMLTRIALVVDDCEISRNAFNAISPEVDHIWTMSIDDALAVLNCCHKAIQYILVSDTLPHWTATELVVKLKREFSNIPLVIMGKNEQVEKEVLSAGADGFIRKPFDRIRDQIGKAVEKRQIRP